VSNNYVLDDLQLNWVQEQLRVTIRNSRQLAATFSKQAARGDPSWKEKLEALEHRISFYEGFLQTVGGSEVRPLAGPLLLEQPDRGRPKEPDDPSRPCAQPGPRKKRDKVKQPSANAKQLQLWGLNGVPSTT
jgi:hypothetical protein